MTNEQTSVTQRPGLGSEVDALSWKENRSSMLPLNILVLSSREMLKFTQLTHNSPFNFFDEVKSLLPLDVIAHLLQLGKFAGS